MQEVRGRFSFGGPTRESSWKLIIRVTQLTHAGGLAVGHNWLDIAVLSAGSGIVSRVWSVRANEMAWTYL